MNQLDIILPTPRTETGKKTLGYLDSKLFSTVFKTLRLYVNLNVAYAIVLTFDNELAGFMEPWCV